ncbi:MAG: hypothetical protein Q9216_006367, partial [Gyalolechia sp. 2 TL-2023]
MTGRVSKFGDAPSPLPLSLWSFKPDGTGSGTWNEEIPPNDSRLNGLKRCDDGYVGSGGNAALVLGGVVSDMTDPQTSDVYDIPGLVKFNMTTQEFTNSSATAFTLNGTGRAGQMHYVPSFGPQGIFLIMGGLFPSNEALFSLESISVYEAGTNQLYNQTATGNFPEGRVGFCLAGINSTEGSYEVFLYGGTNNHLGPDAVPYDEIFLLTLPAFHWIKVDYPPQFPRGGHSCNAVGGSQIISVGGYDANPEIFVNALYDDVALSQLNSSADPLTQGLGIFDMTTLAWIDHFTANAAPYTQSDMVREYYRNNPPDGSQFSTTGLRDIFRTTRFTPVSSAPSQSNTTFPSDPSDSDSSSSNTGAMAGGVVGGVAGLAALTGILFYFRRRHRSKRQQAPTTSSGDVLGPNSNDHLESAGPVDPHQEPITIQEAEDTEYRGAQLEGNGIQEMQHPPAEMGEGNPYRGQ